MGYTYMLQCFKSMFQTIKAHACMNDAHVYEMQVQLCKPNTEVLQTHSLIAVSRVAKPRAPCMHA